MAFTFDKDDQDVVHVDLSACKEDQWTFVVAHIAGLNTGITWCYWHPRVLSVDELRRLQACSVKGK